MMRTRVLPAGGYWEAVAATVKEMLAGRDPREALVIVPTTAHLPVFLRAIAAALRGAAGPGPCLPPRTATWVQLLNAGGEGADPAADVARVWGVFQQLQETGEIKEWFGGAPAQWLAAARELVSLADELLLARAAHQLEGATDLAGLLQRRFDARAWRAAQPELALVEAVTAALARLPGGTTAVLEGMGALGSQPLWAGARLRVLVFDRPPGHPMDRLLLAAAAQGEHLVLQPDTPAVLRAQPVVAAAWPELVDEEASADRLEADADLSGGPQAGAPGTPPLQAGTDAGSARPSIAWVPCTAFEEAAQQAAQRVVETLRADPAARVALVSIDRGLARRVRALLERASVAVVDETGWKLSTTAAATAVMRALECLMDERAEALVDWLQSPFVQAPGWTEAAAKDGVVQALARALQEGRVVRGYAAMRQALSEADGPGRRARERALAVLERLAAARAAWRGQASPGVFLELLEAFGVPAALRADAAGAQVLHVLQTAARGLAASRISLPLWRSLLATEFEHATFRDLAVDSPVVLLPLASTRLRDFDLAVLLGADERQLPLRVAPSLFFTDAVRAELGLATAAERERRTLEDLALLCARTPRCAVVWQERERDEPIAASPWLTRLRLALGDRLERPAPAAGVEVTPAPTPQARPAARHRPLRWSASLYQTLIECPYRYFVRAVLGLKEVEEATEQPEKRHAGSALHEALHRFHREEPAGEGEDAARVRLDAAIAECFAGLTRRNPAFTARLSEARTAVPAYVALWHAMRAEGWRWEAGEQVAETRLVLGEEAVPLYGRIDRIDVLDGALPVRRVIDYKTTPEAELKRRLRTRGEEAQLPFYGLLLEGEGGAGERAALEAGYVALDRDRTAWVPDAGYAEGLEVFRARFLDHAARLAAGTTLPAHGADRVCRRCAARGLCRKGYWLEGEES